MKTIIVGLILFLLQVDREAWSMDKEDTSLARQKGISKDDLKKQNYSLNLEEDLQKSATKIKTISPSRIYQGSEDFLKLVQKSTIIIDKSLFIKEIIDSNSEVTLITMPRRWGKSMNLNMLKRFLEIGEDGIIKEGEEKEKTENYQLFFNTKKISNYGLLPLKISKIDDEKVEKFKAQQGTYPVIHLNFKDCKGDNYKSIFNAVKNQITKCFEEHSYLIENKKKFGFSTVGSSISKIFKKIENSKPDCSTDVEESIKNLSELLCKHFNKKVWVLVDEYDAPANHAYMTFKDENETHRVTGFFSRLYGSVFKGNGNNIEKGILTGIQYVLIDEDSGFNNADKHNITTLKYTPYYGLDQIEVDNLFNHFDISNDKKEVIKSFYNGYHIKDINSTFTPKYNIYSLIKYLDAQDQGLEGYWQETKSFDFIKNLFNKKEILSDILDLINQKSIVFDLNTKFSKNDFKKLVKIINESDHSKITQAGKDTLYSYLLITGYLTNSPDDGGYHIPNTEIIKPFAQELKTYFKTIYKIPQKNFTDSTKNLGEIFTKIENDVYNYKEAVDAFSNSFQEIILSLFQDKQNLPHANEDLFHSLVNIVALNTVGKTMGTEIYTKKVIDGQYTSKKGRADIILANENTGMIIEMKYDGDVEKALEQAQEYENLIKDKTTKLFIGLNVTKDKKVEVKHLLNFNVAKKQ